MNGPSRFGRALRGAAALACYPLARRRFQGLRVYSVEETLDKMLEGPVSVSRFGDGELHWMCMDEQDSFQRNSPELSLRLREVLSSRLEGHIVCLPPELAAPQRDAVPSSVRYWKRTVAACGRRWAGLIDLDRPYYNASVSRLYIKYRSAAAAEACFPRWKQLWDRREVLLIEGEQTRFGVGNDLLANAARVQRLLAPARNAFDRYAGILEQGRRLGAGKLILIALGPAATVLAYDLARCGCWAVDVGHLDIEYDWFRMGTERKTAVRGKYVNEAGGASAFAELDEEDLAEYRSQIAGSI